MIHFPDYAFSPLREPVRWTADAAPHLSGVFGAVVLHGSEESQSAGAPLGPLTADAWVVAVPAVTSMAARIQTGDAIERINSGEKLTVQQTVKDESGWWLVCTAAERSPV